MKKLIINGDDFGFSEAYNYGIIHAFEHGILKSASIMSNMDAAVHAAALAKMHPKLCISQHMNIVQGKCCADPATIPSIVRLDGTFYRSGEYKPDGYAKKTGGTRVADKEDVKREARAQLERLKQLLGYYPVHMEGHSIIQEPIMQGLKEVAEEYGIHCKTYDKFHQEGFLDVGYPNNPPDSLKPVDDYMTYGMSVDSLLQTLKWMKTLDYDICALHCHPGYVDATIMDSSTLILPRCRDLQTLCNPHVAKWIKDNHIELIRYDEIKLS